MQGNGCAHIFKWLAYTERKRSLQYQYIGLILLRNVSLILHTEELLSSLKLFCYYVMF